MGKEGTVFIFAQRKGQFGDQFIAPFAHDDIFVLVRLVSARSAAVKRQTDRIQNTGFARTGIAGDQEDPSLVVIGIKIDLGFAVKRVDILEPEFLEFHDRTRGNRFRFFRRFRRIADCILGLTVIFHQLGFLFIRGHFPVGVQGFQKHLFRGQFRQLPVV